MEVQVDAQRVKDPTAIAYFTTDRVDDEGMTWREPVYETARRLTADEARLIAARLDNGEIGASGPVPRREPIEAAAARELRIAARDQQVPLLNRVIGKPSGLGRYIQVIESERDE